MCILVFRVNVQDCFKIESRFFIMSTFFVNDAKAVK